MCGFSFGPQDNWLITQYIYRVVDGFRLPQVRVQIDFSELGGCYKIACQKTFVLNIYETSPTTSREDTKNYQIISRMALSTSNRHNLTKEINFETRENGFYLAITDEASCMTISRVLVFYNVCPQETKLFVNRPETIAPPIGNLHMPREVTATCVAGASPENGVAPKLICMQEGVWGFLSGLGCHCNPGFFESKDKRSCITS